MKRTKTKSIFGALCLFFAISLFSVFLSISFTRQIRNRGVHKKQNTPVKQGCFYTEIGGQK